MSALAMRPPRSRTSLAACSTKMREARTPPLRVGWREVRADIAGAAGGEQRVGQRMQRDIGIGMAGQLLRMRDRDAAQHHVIAGLEGVHVVAIAGAHVGKRLRRAESRWSAMAMSLAQVSFTLSGEPATICTGISAHSAIAASSVKPVFPAR